MPPLSAVGQIAAAQRSKNARLITSGVSLLTFAAAFIVLGAGAGIGLCAFLVLASLGMALTYLLARRERIALAVLLTIVCILVEHVGTVALSKSLGPVPYIAPIGILLAAPTMPARWLPVSFSACLLALGIEGWLSPWSRADQESVVAAALFSLLVFLVSWLHVRGTEHAFAIAESQDRARAIAAAAAMESERRYRLIADSADDLIALVDRAGKALYLSPSNERVLGLPVAATIGESLAERLNIENVDAASEAFERALTEGEGRVELRVRRGDGKLRILDARMNRVDAEQGTFVAIISRDVSERRDLEMRLQASERLEALGRLAGSVAHDFNNLLTVIGGAAEMARGFVAADHPAREDLDAVLAATETATDLSRQLLTFSRRQVVVRKRVDITSVLRGEHEVLTRLVGRNVRLEYQLEENLPPVLMPEAHVEQLAINLAGNGRDAMPSGGRLFISTRRRVLADREVGDLVAGLYIELTVRDEGTGIPSDVLPHVFEPLFSTKGGHGTGLGLATCQGVAVQAGGAIQVESEEGKGSTFRVLLPAADAVPSPVVGPAAPQILRRVLVVDDDASVRDLTTRMLRAEGHEVLTASTIAEARSILADAAIRLDAMVTDVVLGQERGTDLIAPSRKARPLLRLVVTSGYAPDPGASEAVEAYGAEFLPKPFGRDQLLRALHGG